MFRYDYKKNHFAKDLAAIIIKHSLFEKSFSVSRFHTMSLSILNDLKVKPMGFSDTLEIESFDTVIAYDGVNPIGIVIFERYKKTLETNQKFTHKQNKAQYTMLGFVGTYVMPEYRKKGIASKLLETLYSFIASEYSSTKEHIFMISAVDRTYKIIKHMVHKIFISQSPGNNTAWKRHAKDVLTYHQF